MRRERLRAVLGATVLGLLAGTLPASAGPSSAAAGARGVAAPVTWYAGAAAERITPPPYDASRDAVEFPGCDTRVFSGARHFDFEEPYIDSAGTGYFDYTRDRYCDANHNGRHDELYSSGGVDHILEWVHDDIWARALAVSDGRRTVVVESITSQGLMNEDIELIRQGIGALGPGAPLNAGASSGLVGYRPRNGLPSVAELFASSTHNESSPDPIGIYGAPDDGTGSAGVFSGIDDYYIAYLVEQSIRAGREAADAMVPATMRVGELRSSEVAARLSSTFPTTDSLRTGSHDDTSAATDTELRVLQLRSAVDGSNIETVLNFAAHNQQVGHADDSQLYQGAPGDPDNGRRVNRAVSDDWPGMFAQTVERAVGGHAMFMVADNGSIEDPHPTSGANLCPGGQSEGCFQLAGLTGPALGDDVLGELGSGTMDTVMPHAITFRRDHFDVPLRNQLFIAAFASGLFAHRHAALDGAAQGIAGPALRTEVGLLDLGPSLQMLVNPGEAYPATVEGNPWGADEVPCPSRPQPVVGGVAAVPAWHATAAHHLEMGLGDDMIGYLIPGPEWFADPAVYADPACADAPSPGSDPTSDVDPRGHYHKLESESVGPEAGTLVAEHLSALADAMDGGRDGRVIDQGRFLRADGSMTRRGTDSPVAMWVLPRGVTTFAPGRGMLIGAPGVTEVGGMRVDATGTFMDFEGHPQPAPDIDTRGMMVTAADGTVRRYYMDPYAVLGGV